MPNDCVSYQESGFFSDIIIDYLNQKENLKPLYNRFPNLENFEDQILEKSKNFEKQKRKTLVTCLEQQYVGLKSSDLTQKNIIALHKNNTYTITTGHQLNLFSGPLYFLYKIITVINLCKDLKSKYPLNNFVPMYWMATEDHDFEEINYFNYKDKKIVWNSNQTGAVGRFSTIGLEEVFEVFETELGIGKNAEYLKNIFQKAYLEHDNLAKATQFLVNELFGIYGLVIIDGDDKELKKQFIPYLENEILNQQSFAKVQETISKLQDYKIQVNPREINLFYIEKGLRERIVFENGNYKINNTTIIFNKNEILTELKNASEKFSPNVILRPLYQELILPNLCYVGGGGEIAYWLELKSMFDYYQVTFPVLLVRNSVVLVTGKQAEKANKMNLTWNDLFKNSNELINLKTKQLSLIEIDFEQQKSFLHKQFVDLYKLANQTDKSFLGAVKAQEAKQIKGLENLEKRLLKAQKRKFSEQLQNILNLKNEIFPNDGLQERKSNFSEFYNQNLIDKLVQDLNPLTAKFTIIQQ